MEIRIRCIKTVRVNNSLGRIAFTLGQEYKATALPNGKWETVNDYGGQHFLSRSTKTGGMEWFHKHFVEISDAHDAHDANDVNDVNDVNAAYERAMSIL